jgi:hypothetical protein
MDAIDFWFLDSVCEVIQPMYLLTAEDMQTWLNRPAHGLNESQIIETLQRLVASGDLHAFSDDRGEFLPTETEIAAGVTGGLDASYGLTSQGGARWEEAAKADWRRYIDEIYGPEDSTGEIQAPYGEQVGEITGSSREIVEAYFSGIKFNGVVARAGTEIWDSFSPWAATYWKKLPEAHRVRYFCIYAQPPAPESIPDWFRQIRHWYTLPGEKPVTL